MNRLNLSIKEQLELIAVNELSKADFVLFFNKLDESEKELIRAEVKSFLKVLYSSEQYYKYIVYTEHEIKSERPLMIRLFEKHGVDIPISKHTMVSFNEDEDGKEVIIYDKDEILYKPENRIEQLYKLIRNKSLNGINTTETNQSEPPEQPEKASYPFILEEYRTLFDESTKKQDKKKAQWVSLIWFLLKDETNEKKYFIESLRYSDYVQFIIDGKYFESPNVSEQDKNFLNKFLLAKRSIYAEPQCFSEKRAKNIKHLFDVT